MSLKEYLGKWLEVVDYKEAIEALRAVSKICKINLICPRYTLIFKAFECCQLSNLKVVMIGQDPYPQKGVATGLLFGNSKTVSEDKLSPSLKVVKKSIENLEDKNKRLIFDNSMGEWAKQGILLINSAMTCEMNKVGSHTMLWRPFISKLLTNLSNREHIVYVLFGSTAQTFEHFIDSKNNTIIKIEHPVFFARINKDMPSDVFSRVNEALKEYKKEPIIW